MNQLAVEKDIHGRLDQRQSTKSSAASCDVGAGSEATCRSLPQLGPAVGQLLSRITYAMLKIINPPEYTA
jgi:hypothetical protein